MGRFRNIEPVKSCIKSIVTYEGEFLERKLQRVIQNNEAITEGAPIIYTDKAKGVQPAYNHRTDKWELAAESMDVVHRGQNSKFAPQVDKTLKNGDVHNNDVDSVSSGADASE